MKRQIPADVRGMFRGIRISEKALRKVDEMMMRSARLAMQVVHAETERLRATVIPAEQLMHYNAGYMRACSDIFGIRERDGIQAFQIATDHGFRRVVLDESGRLHLED